MHRPDSHWDVIVVGGGPAGSTVVALFRKHDPTIRIAETPVPDGRMTATHDPAPPSIAKTTVLHSHEQPGA